MNAINVGLTIHRTGSHILAIDQAGMINISLLLKPFRGCVPHEYFYIADALPVLADAAGALDKTIPPQWSDVRHVRANRQNFVMALQVAGVIRQVPGTVAGHAQAAKGVAGQGLYDYHPGLWVRPEIAAAMARWAEIGGNDTRPSPLAEFVEKSIKLTGDHKPEAVAVESAAACFARQVDKRTLANLHRIDQMLIEAETVFSERVEILQSRLDQHAE